MASPCLFEPNGELQHLVTCFDQIPQYLFRTYAPASNGKSNEISIISSAVYQKKDSKDLLSLDTGRAASMLEDHLLWRKFHSDNLMSWTNSFLFAIQHGIHRHAKDWDHPKLSEIRICVLDTRKCPQGSFLPAVALLKTFRVPSSGKLSHDYYHGEFISQGVLTVPDRSVTTSLEALVENGLYRIFPPFADSDRKYQLYNRVVELRSTFSEPPVPTAVEDIERARLLAVSCFSDKWKLPIMVMLLSLRRRPHPDETILKEFRDIFSGNRSALRLQRQ
jgi:hypothetical protein